MTPDAPRLSDYWRDRCVELILLAFASPERKPCLAEQLLRAVERPRPRGLFAAQTFEIPSAAIAQHLYRQSRRLESRYQFVWWWRWHNLLRPWYRSVGPLPSQGANRGAIYRWRVVIWMLEIRRWAERGEGIE